MFVCTAYNSQLDIDWCLWLSPSTLFGWSCRDNMLVTMMTSWQKNAFLINVPFLWHPRLDPRNGPVMRKFHVSLLLAWTCSRKSSRVTDDRHHDAHGTPLQWEKERERAAQIGIVVDCVKSTINGPSYIARQYNGKRGTHRKRTISRL